jgi:hypothetical protein
MRKLVLLVAAALVVTLTVVGSAAVARGGKDVRGHHAHLSGWQEVPTVMTTGNGRFRITKIDRSAKTIAYRLEIRKLEGALTPGTGASGQAHLHFAKRKINGGIAAFLCGGGDKPACTVGSPITGTIDEADILAIAAQGFSANSFDEFIAALRHGALYANVHTTLFPGGEIRGQVVNNQRHRGHFFDRDKD